MTIVQEGAHLCLHAGLQFHFQQRLRPFQQQLVRVTPLTLGLFEDVFPTGETLATHPAMASTVI